jgi:tetratricopeptide (TPR) repeat protein
VPLEQKLEVELRFCEFFVEFFRARADVASEGDHSLALEQIRLETDNLFRCLKLVSEHKRFELLESILEQIHLVFEELSLYASGANLLKTITNSVRIRTSSKDDQSPFLGKLLAVLSFFLSKAGENKTAVEMAREGITILEPHKDFEFLGICATTLGMVVHLEGKLEAAVSAYNTAIGYFLNAKNKRGMARCYNRLGVVHWSLGKLEESITLHQMAIDSAQLFQDDVEIANGLNSIGVAFESTGRIEQAIEQYQKSLQIHLKTGYLRGQAAALTNLGHVNERVGNMTAAKKFYEQSIEIKKTIGDPVITAVSLTNLADVHYALADPIAGHRINFLALEMTQTASATMYSLRILWSFARYLSEANQTPDALYLTYFAADFPDCERWVREEASESIPKLETKLEPHKLELLRTAQNATLVDMI